MRESPDCSVGTKALRAAATSSSLSAGSKLATARSGLFSTAIRMASSREIFSTGPLGAADAAGAATGACDSIWAEAVPAPATASASSGRGRGRGRSPGASGAGTAA